MCLHSASLSLRAPELSDLDYLFHVENDTRQWMVSACKVPYSRFQLQQYIESNAHDIYVDKQLRLMIEREEDKRKFELLYNAFERKMYGKAMTIVHKPHLAEDVLQETFTYVAMHMDKIDDPESDSTLAFLTVVTKHKAYDCLRKEAVREKWHADYEERG